MDLKRFSIRDLRFGKIKKNDFIILILAGILLMVIAVPLGSEKSENSGNLKAKNQDSSQQEKDYVDSLEQQLELMLSQMDGVGKVKVMITVEDDGRKVLDKNVKNDEKSLEQQTVIYDEGKDSVPYVTSQNMPKIKGVMIVAQGGGNSAVQNNISEAVMALFDIELHKIKIVKMSNQEE